MHEWTPDTDLFAHSVIGYAIERLRLPKDPMWGAIPAADLDQALAHAVTPQGVGGLEALRLFRDVLMPACRPMDDPMNLAYVPTAPSIAATMAPGSSLGRVRRLPDETRRCASDSCSATRVMSRRPSSNP